MTRLPRQNTLNTQRDLTFDLLRSLIIISAVILHFDNRFSLGLLATPFLVVQNFFFTVGGFFFFTSGYMANRVYLERFKHDPGKTSTSIFLKGLSILFVYLLYVFLMHIFTDTSLPGNMVEFICDHRFFTKVLFTFSILFMVTPVILIVYVNTPKWITVFGLLLVLMSILFAQQVPIPLPLKQIFVDRTLFFYPLLPSLFVYAGGFWFGSIDSQDTGKSKRVGIAIGVLCVHILLVLGLDSYRRTVLDRNYFTLWESLLPICFIILIRAATSIKALSNILSTPYLLCLGIFSLHYYVISNVFISLLSISPESDPVTKLLGLLGVVSITYLFTFWRFRSEYPIPRL